jgi:hypothetical protein
MSNRTTLNLDSSGATLNNLPDSAGFLFLADSSIFYGSNFLPAKKCQTGDGVFFQFVSCIAIWCVGLIMNACSGLTMQLHALPMMGGFFWYCANILSVATVQTLGLSLGVMLWGKIGIKLIIQLFFSNTN